MYSLFILFGEVDIHKLVCAQEHPTGAGGNILLYRVLIMWLGHDYSFIRITKGL